MNSKPEKNLTSFLEKKTLFYNEININIIKIAWEFVRLFTKPKYTIHIVGTNGKGSTGRILASYLYKKGYTVLHYTSPHINKFNERIWIDGENISDELLQDSHEKLLSILPDDIIQKLTYFEYTTLIALLLADNTDYLILEAGLGGEFDATNVIINDLSLITTIDFDHQDFLGNTIEQIASTKIRSVDNTMIIANQIHQEVYNIAYQIAKTKKLKCFKLDDFRSSQNEYTIFTQKFLNQNLKTVLAALEHLRIEIDLKCFKDIKFEGRCENISPNLTIDVGHNPLAAQAILEQFKNKKVNLVYNTLKDKDYRKVLEILKPIINHLYIIDIDDLRSLDKNILEETLTDLKIPFSNFININSNEETLVFGSFKVVEEFLRLYEK